MNRRALGVAASLLVALALACTDVMGPGDSPKFLLLSGVWSSSTATPGGSYIKIATSAAAGHISGIGVAYVSAGVDSLGIDGQYDPTDGSFGMTIAYASGPSSTFTGLAQGAGALSGTWYDWRTGTSYDVAFTRLLVPPCDDSVPLRGTPNPAAPDFIVQFQDTVNATAEAARLGALYGFTPTLVYTAALSGFAANIPLTTVTVLRCEPKVTSVSYDVVGGGA
jgi:hypothetical protein